MKKLLLLLLLSMNIYAADVTMSWDPRPETDIVEYVIYEYKQVNDVLSWVEVASIKVPARGLPKPKLVFRQFNDGIERTFAVSAVNSIGLESPLSESKGVAKNPAREAAPQQIKNFKVEKN